jgi:hypothetical protein
VPAVEHQFEPMSVGMVLATTFRLYSQNFSLMFGITAILHAPFLFFSIIPVLFWPSGNNPILGLLVALSASLLGLLNLLIVYPLSTGATTKAVSDRYLGQDVTIRSALSEAWVNVGTLLLTQLVVGVLVFVGFILLVVPGILWMLSYALVPPVIMIEASNRKLSRQVYSITGDAKGTTPVIMERADIRRRSYQLVSGNRGKVFLTLLLFIVLSFLLSLGADWIINTLFESQSLVAFRAQTIVGSLINIAVSPLQTIAITLLYYDLRIRKEGFDLEMLSQAMGAPAVNA